MSFFLVIARLVNLLAFAAGLANIIKTWGSGYHFSSKNSPHVNCSARGRQLMPCQTAVPTAVPGPPQKTMVRPPPRKRPRFSPFLAVVALGAAALLSVLPTGTSFTVHPAGLTQTSVGFGRQRTQLSAFSAVDAATAVASATGSSGSLPNDNNAFRLVQYREAVEFQTAMYKLTRRNTDRDRDAANVDDKDEEIVLVSMVHLADQDYYTEIMREADSADRVLFELIVGPEVSGVDGDGNRAVTDYVYPTREQVMDESIDRRMYNNRVRFVHHAVLVGPFCFGIGVI